MNVKDGVFFLQRTEDSYLARFEFMAEGIQHFNDTDIIDYGDNISAIRLINPKITEGRVIPEVPVFEAIENEDIDLDTQFTIMGYPD
jgi:hypothetical protein